MSVHGSVLPNLIVYDTYQHSFLAMTPCLGVKLDCLARLAPMGASVRLNPTKLSFETFLFK